MDVEVALDPELLGQCFENLLAAFNPETKKAARDRKKTGSYYTPRKVVDYMAEEALVAALAARVKPTEASGRTNWRSRLRYLLSHSEWPENPDFFSAEETRHLVRAIAALRILDPACGSGAFPMGVLHKLTLALRRLDPNNVLWEATQKDRASTRASDAFDNRDPVTREAELRDIQRSL